MSKDTKDTVVIESPWRLGAEWLLHSGIQDQSDSLEFKGGVNAWYDLRNGTYPFIYSEITGYAVNAYLYFYEITSEASYLNAAKAAGDWLCNNRDGTTGLVPTRRIHSEDHANYFTSNFFLFDEWIIAYGLGCLAEITQDDKYLAVAQEIVDFLLKSNSKSNGSFEPLYNSETKKPEGFGDKWSRQPGSYHAKHLMALFQLFKMTRDDKYMQAADQLAEWTISIQKDNGRFVTQDNEDSTHLHPHLYTLEGLLYFGINAGNDSCVESALMGLRWILNHQNPDGGVYCWFINQEFSPFERTDVLAQTLRVGAVLRSRHQLNKEEESALEKLRIKLLGYQLCAGDQKGAFLYGQEETGAVHYHANAWVTMFAVQALHLYEESSKKGMQTKMNYFA